MEHVISAIKIFKQLLSQGEFNRREQAFLYSEYLEPGVQEVLSCFEEEFECRFLNFDENIYLIPNSDSRLIGVQPGEIRRYFGASATNKDVCLAYYIMMFILYEFYNGKNKDPKRTDFIQVGHLINRLDERFERIGNLGGKMWIDGRRNTASIWHRAWKYGSACWRITNPKGGQKSG